jgi:transposase
MKALSLDLRTRIVAACDRGEQTQQQVADRFEVSLGMVQKLLKQRRRIGDLSAQYQRCGGKTKIFPEHQELMRNLLQERPDMTLGELRDACGLSCTLPAIHGVLNKMGLTYKKRRSVPVSKTAKTSPKSAGSGAEGKAS